MSTFKTLDLKPFRMNIGRKTGGPHPARLEKQNARRGQAARGGIESSNCRGQDGGESALALRFSSLFLPGFFRLFFFLQLVADDLEDGDLRSVAHADACMNDPRIAASAVREFRRDFAEQ